MPQNRIQFQKSLSLPEFLDKYGSEAQCAAALEKMRWPQGYACPYCESKKTLHCKAQQGKNIPVQLLPRPNDINWRHHLSFYEDAFNYLVSGDVLSISDQE